MVKFHFTCEVEAENIVEAFKKLGLSQNQTNAGEVAVTCTHISVPEQPTQIQSAPVVPTVAPVASIPQPIAPIIPPAPVVPTTAPTYTFDQIAAAGATLVDSGKQQEVIALLGQFGVQALTQLPPEHYGSFVVELRKMGAAL